MRIEKRIGSQANVQKQRRSCFACMLIYEKYKQYWRHIKMKLLNREFFF